MKVTTNIYGFFNSNGEKLKEVKCSTPEKAFEKCKSMYGDSASLIEIKPIGTFEL